LHLVQPPKFRFCFFFFNPFFYPIFFPGDGLIQEKELQHVMRACMDENGMKFDEGEVDELTRALFHDATVVSSNANSGGITFDALKAQLTKHDGLLQNLSISIDRWLVPPKPKKTSLFYGICDEQSKFFFPVKL